MFVDDQAEGENKVEGTDINRYSNVSDEPQDLRARDAYNGKFNLQQRM